MEIISIEYTTPEKDTIKITTEDGVISFCPYPCRSYQQEFILKWLQKGFEIIPYKNPKPSWEEIKLERNQKLQESDWTQLSDVTLPEKKVKAWKKYRENLRKINQMYYENNSNVYFPTTPD